MNTIAMPKWLKFNIVRIQGFGTFINMNNMPKWLKLCILKSYE